MKKSTILIISLIGVSGILATFFFTTNNGQRMDSNSIPNGMKHYTQTVDNLNEGWANIRLGDSYRKSGDFDRSIEAYKKAYEIDRGNRVYTGDILIKTYEQLGRYDEAIIIIDDILKNKHLAKKGINDFTVMRNRLLAAKAQAAQ